MAQSAWRVLCARGSGSILLVAGVRRHSLKKLTQSRPLFRVPGASGDVLKNCEEPILQGMKIAPSADRPSRETQPLQAAPIQSGGSTLSVVMSTYNDGSYLLRSVGSILQQSFVDFEFIIVNDGSTDDTQALLESLDDSRIRLVEQDNQGVVDALNRGVELAQGTYVARIDGDDRSAPERLRRQFEFMESNPEHVLVGTWWRVRDLDGKLLGEYRCPTTDVALRWKLLLDIPFPHSSMMIRRSAFEAVGGYDAEYRFAQDYELVTRLAAVGKIGAVPAFLTDWQLDHLEGRSICFHNEQRRFVHRISRHEQRKLGATAVLGEQEAEAVWRIVKQPWAVTVTRAKLGADALGKLRSAFIERHSGPVAARAVSSALRRYAKALLKARAVSRKVLLSRIILAWRLDWRSCVSRLGFRTVVRLMSRAIAGGAA